jgi:hypothetical protein
MAYNFQGGLKFPPLRVPGRRHEICFTQNEKIFKKITFFLFLRKSRKKSLQNDPKFA